MMRRKVEDVMTRSVAYATKDTPYKELIRLLAERRVSALPVVSEADLLLKQEHPADAFQRFFLERKRDRLQRAKAHGATAAELMTRPAITVGPEVPIAQAARLLRKHLVRRLPVVDRLGRLVGIVSRSDLLRVFLRPDQEIRREVVDEVIRRDLLTDPARFQVSVGNGVVVLEGNCERRSLITLPVAAVGGDEGGVGVEDRLGYDADDTATLP